MLVNILIYTGLTASPVTFMIFVYTCGREFELNLTLKRLRPYYFMLQMSPKLRAGMFALQSRVSALKHQWYWMSFKVSVALN